MSTGRLMRVAVVAVLSLTFGLIIATAFGVDQQQQQLDIPEKPSFPILDTSDLTRSTEIDAALTRLTETVKENQRARSTLNSGISDLLSDTPKRSD